MTDGRDHVRRSKRYTWAATETGYPFYGRWDLWLGTLLTVYPAVLLVSVLVPSVAVRVVVAVVGIGVSLEVSRAALGVLRADRSHRRHVAEAMSEETGAEITVDQLAHLYARLHRNSADSSRSTPKKASADHTAPDGSTVTITMFRDETVTAVRRRPTE